MRAAFTAFIGQQSACGDLDRERAPARALRKCQREGCAALVAPPRKYCVPCGDELRDAKVHARRREQREQERLRRAND
jgi:hypothetical protein